MGKINYGRVFLGGLVALIAMIIAELVLENLILANIGCVGSARLRFIEAFGKTMPEGWINEIINAVIGYVTACLWIWVYAAMRPRFGPGPKTALMTAAVFIVYWATLLVWFSNVGLFPVKLSVVSFVTNLIELPLAILAGAWVYRE